MATTDDTRSAGTSTTNSGAGPKAEARLAEERRPAAARAAAAAYEATRERTASA